MNNTAELQGRKFNGKHYPKIKWIKTEPRQKIRSKLRDFLPLHLEKFAETLPMSQGISMRNPRFNPML